jgi:hypothetical protein
MKQTLLHLPSVTQYTRSSLFQIIAYWFSREGYLEKKYGPTIDNDGTWRIKTNEELEILIKRKNIVRFIKSQRLRWVAHAVRMDTTRIVKKVIEQCSSRPVGRPRLRWLDQVEDDLKKMKVRNWREKCKDRKLWNEIVKQAKTHQGL